jgi:hypothetical protein
LAEIYNAVMDESLFLLKGIKFALHLAEIYNAVMDESLFLLKGIKFALHLAEIYNAAETMAFIRFGPERIGHGTFIHPATGTIDTHSPP